MYAALAGLVSIVVAIEGLHPSLRYFAASWLPILVSIVSERLRPPVDISPFRGYPLLVSQQFYSWNMLLHNFLWLGDIVLADKDIEMCCYFSGKLRVAAKEPGSKYFGYLDNGGNTCF